MIVLLDNFDSFTWNLWHFLSELGAKVEVIRNNELKVPELIKLKPKGIIISPGPGTPKTAGIALKLIKEVKDTIPILGVCLGHQAIAEAYGGELIKLNPPIHGKLSLISHDNKGVLDLIPKKPFKITRYHSLAVGKSSLPKDLIVTAFSDDNVIMAIKHAKYEVHGVQFHPESVLSMYGYRIFSSFLMKCGYKNNTIEEFEILEKKLIGNLK